DAAHKKLADLVRNGQPLPVDFKNRFIYYVGPVDPIAGEAVGPAGPTTATRMDKFTDLMLGEQVGLIGMVGKSERGPEAIASIKAHGGVYCIAVGGAAYLVAKAIKAARVLAFPELGMEAVYEFDVENMPVTVAVDSAGNSVHDSGPREWRLKIGKIPLAAH
ncbi:MAG TPA: fumarate hydratase C-terminal domain-containing protein, partial [Thiobacillaceae bacterium]|nr:fumarate hydratase C-terminal domain-containing protein [Thiobacillaceae bacterium]